MKKKLVKTETALPEIDILKLKHKLEVHQIELELQNEELLLAKRKADIAVEKYTELYEFAPLGYFTLSKEGKILEMNICGSQMLGKERTLLKNRQFASFLSARTKPTFNTFLDNVFKTQSKETCEMAISTGKTIDRYVELTGIMTDNGEQCLATMLDITERKKTQETLLNSEKQARALINAIPDLMFRINREGVFNDYKADPEDLAFQDQSIIGRKSRDTLPPELAGLIDEKITLTLQTNQLQVFEYQLFLPSRGIRSFEARMVPCNSDEVIVIVRDITDRKNTEAEIMLKNEELSRANTEKDKFFSIIAHDLRSPFNAFLGFTQMMVDELDTFTLKELQHIAVSMRNSANNLFGLLENLLEWSRMQRGITGFDPRPISLIRLITDSIQSVTGPADKKGIDIVYNIPENLEVFADANMIGSTIRNLVSNAVKFTFKGGWITIGATPMPDHSVLISVKDSGIGMNKTILHNLFNLDEQTNRKGTDDEPSTGLGLLLCKDFIEKHNGKLWVDSTEGTGSTFCFSLPGNPSIKP